jgi:hypothetical protein
MFDRLTNGWNIVCQSWGVLRKDKELLLFPILSGIAAIVVLASFVLPVLLVPGLRETLHAMLDKVDDNGKVEPATKIIMGVATLAFYFVNYFVIVYFNTALAACAIYRFRGGDPTVGLGFRMANKRLPQIAAWSLLAATVGLILNMLEERAEWLGKLVIAIIGGLWTIATYLVVPTLAVEGLGPVAALKRSTSLIGKAWGEGLAGNFSIGLVTFVLLLPAFLIMFGLVAANLPPAVLMVAGVAAVLYGLIVVVVSAALKQIFISGLYVYATENRVPPGFDRGTMNSAFAAR